MTIQDEFKENGYFISLYDAYQLWEKLSDDASASWLNVDSYKGNLFEYISCSSDPSIFPSFRKIL